MCRAYNDHLDWEDEQNVEKNIHDYYGSLEAFVDRVGKWAWVYKLDQNCREGVYPAQKVRYEYFKTDAAMQQEKEARRMDVWAAARKFNLAAERIGQPKMSDSDIKFFANFLIDSKNRAYFKKCAKRNDAKFLPVSLAQILEERKALNKKREEKKGES